MQNTVCLKGIVAVQKQPIYQVQPETIALAVPSVSCSQERETAAVMVWVTATTPS